jgi:hypothetical protein
MGPTSSATLVLVRHGESEWNALNLFTGWVDVGLTDKGRAEAIRSGELLVEHNLLPDVVYTSLLRRAITTANLALDTADRHWIPVRRSWRLNERHYGVLQGLDKADIKQRYGEEQFMAWRRSYDTPPPPIERGSRFSQDTDPRYANIGGGPLTECLAAGEVPRRHVGRGSRRAEHPNRDSAALRPGRDVAASGWRRHLSRPGGRRRRCGCRRQPGHEIARASNGRLWHAAE